MKLSRHLRKAGIRLMHPLLADSVYFYTFHKCASALFSNYILPNVRGLEQVDPFSAIFDGERDPDAPIRFLKKGRVYGPIRLSRLSTKNRVWKCSHVFKEIDFVRDKRMVCMVRDPRDILVSMYYSAGYSHSLSPVKSIAEGQLKRREKVLNTSIDDFVLSSATGMTKSFELMHELRQASPDALTLHYEDLIHDFEGFCSQLTSRLPLPDKVIKRIHDRTRPKDVEDIHAHHRSGKTGDHRNKLKPETIEELNRIMASAMTPFGYSD